MKKTRWNKYKFKSNIMELLKIIIGGGLMGVIILFIFLYGLYLENGGY